MRLMRRNADGEMVEFRLPLMVIGVLVGLAFLGAGGAAVVSVITPDAPNVVDRMGPKANYASLPEMTFVMGGGGGTARSIDMKVLIELDPRVNPGVTVPFEARIADRLGDRVREIGLERLQGVEGARLLKKAIASVVDREIRPVRVRDVLLERMVVR